MHTYYSNNLRGERRESITYLNVEDVVQAFLPVSLPHGMCGSHHVLPHVLWWAHQRLLLMVPQLVVEALGDDATAAFSLCSCTLV